MGIRWQAWIIPSDSLLRKVMEKEYEKHVIHLHQNMIWQGFLVYTSTTPRCHPCPHKQTHFFFFFTDTLDHATWMLCFKKNQHRNPGVLARILIHLCAEAKGLILGVWDFVIGNRSFRCLRREAACSFGSRCCKSKAFELSALCLWKNVQVRP